MRRPTLGTGVLVVAMALIAPAPASAANQTVGVDDDVFVPNRVAVKPNETVTWSNPGTTEEHNVVLEDRGALTPPGSPSAGPWSTQQTFAAAGRYPFYCEVHGGPGGTGMSGVVYVNAIGEVPPFAEFVASPGTPEVGQSVAFDASTSTAATGASITKYEWDLDGDGSFETDTATTPTTSRTYTSAQDVDVKVRVTDSRQLSEVRARRLTINAASVAPPAAGPTSQPAPPQPATQPKPAAQPKPVTQPKPATQQPSRSRSPRRPGKCSKLKGRKRAACVRRSCRRLQGAKRRACVKKATRRR